MTTRTLVLAAALLAALAPAAADAQAAPPAERLDHGPHAAGFTVIEALDSTRAFRPRRDFRGRVAPEPARPVQISVWYPAEASPDAPRMRAGEFRLLAESELDFDAGRVAAEADRLRADYIERAVGFGQAREASIRAWDEPTPAIRGARPLPGPHPVVLYFTSAGVSNPLLPAYLASHGFVVASFPSNGRMTEGSLEFTPNALTLDTDIDDAGFVYAVLRGLPYADTRRLAVASFSGGSLAALLWTMRDMQPAAIVAIEGWERYRRGADLIRGSVHYDPRRVRVPFLMLERAADETSPAYAKVPDVVEALPHADITRVSFRDASHGDFLSHAPFGHTSDHAEIYEASLAIVRRFLESHVVETGTEAVARSAPPAPPRSDGLYAVERDPAIEPVPTEEELYRLVETDPSAAVAAYQEATAVVPGSALFRRHVLERAALFAATAADSAAIMEIVSDAYPDTASASGPAPLAGAEPAFIAVSVSDLDEAAEWYQRILDLEVVRDLRSADGSLRARVLSAGPVVVELVHHTSTVPVADALEPRAHRFQLQGIVKSGLFVPDIERLYHALGGRGVERDASIGTDRELEWRFFVFRDLDGNRIQAFERCGAECG